MTSRSDPRPKALVEAGIAKALRGGVGVEGGGGHGWLSKCTMKPAMASCVPMSAAA